MLPKVILHNTISINGAVRGFDANLGIHYGIASSLQPEAFLVGTDTILSAPEEIPREENQDPVEKVIDPTDPRPYWVVVDSRGRLQPVLRYYRNMEYIKDIIVLISEATPHNYRKFLHLHKFESVQAGVDHVNLRVALAVLHEKYKIQTLVTDCGPKLAGILLEQDLVSEFSLIIAPSLVSVNMPQLFENVDFKERNMNSVELKLISCEKTEKEHIHLRYTCCHVGQNA